MLFYCRLSMSVQLWVSWAFMCNWALVLYCTYLIYIAFCVFVSWTVSFGTVHNPRDGCTNLLFCIIFFLKLHNKEFRKRGRTSTTVTANLLFGNSFASKLHKERIGPRGGGVRISSNSLGSITWNHLMESEKYVTSNGICIFVLGCTRISLQTLLTF